MGDNPQNPEQLKEGAQTPETASEQARAEQEKLKESLPRLANERVLAMEDFRKRVREGDHDFMGDDSSDFELYNNPVFKYAYEKLSEIFTENTNEKLPIVHQIKWMQNCVEFMAKTIADFPGGLFTTRTDIDIRMDISDVDETLAKMLDIENGGVGNFENWMQKNYPNEYQNWLRQEENTKQNAESLAVAKEKLIKRVEALEAKIAALQTLPENIKKDLADLKNRIPNASDENFVNGLESIFLKLEASVIAHEKQLAEKAKAEAEQKTAEGKQRQEQEAKEAQQRAAEEEARLDAEEASETPTVDKLLQFTAQLPEDSKLKPILKTIAALLVSIGVGIAKLPWIGNKLRGSFISNKLLAEQGDETAKLALKTERLFRKFSLPRSLANELGGVSTKEAVKVLQKQAAEIKPEEISDEAEKKSAEAEKIKFTNLAAALTERGGDKNEQSLFEFVANKEWESPQTAQAPAPTQQPQQSQAPAVAPQVTAAAATVAAATNKPPEKPAENPETKLIQATNKELDPFNNRTIDLTEQTFAFRLPYLTQSGIIEYANCSIKGNNFEIGGHKYTLELPMSANLQKITIAGPVQTGSTELVAGKFGFSDSKEIPLATLLKNLESLRKEPKNRTITIGNDNATFKYLA